VSRERLRKNTGHGQSTGSDVIEPTTVIPPKAKARVTEPVA